MLLRGTAIVSLLTLLSRALGFIRDLLVANLLGASIFADAFFVAFRIPNLLRSFAAEGALTSAFVPVFSTALARGKREAHVAFQRIAGFVLSLTIPMTILGIVFSSEILGIVAPGFRDDPEKRALAEHLTKIMFPYIIFVSLVAMLNSALNALKVFGASAWAQVLMNVMLIFGALVATPFEPRTATVILALSVVVGGIIQVIAQVPACRKAELPIKASCELTSPEVREVVRLMIPATLGASVYQCNIFIATLLASLLVDGSVSWLFYADRVSQFPVGIFSVALASVLLPTLANASATSNSKEFNSVLANSLRFTSFVIIPMAAGIWALATPLTALLFERGAFDHHSTLMTAAAIQALTMGLWAMSCYSMVVRAFIAKKDTITPSFIGVLSLLAYLVSALVLMGRITPSTNPLVSGLSALQSTITALLPTFSAQGHVGLALSSSISAGVSLALAITIYMLKLGAFPWRSFLRSTGTAILASLVMISAVRILTPFNTPPVFTCFAGSVIGAISYTVASLGLRSVELRDALALMRRKLKRG